MLQSTGALDSSKDLVFFAAGNGNVLFSQKSFDNVADPKRSHWAENPLPFIEEFRRLDLNVLFFNADSDILSKLAYDSGFADLKQLMDLFMLNIWDKVIRYFFQL